MNSVTEEIKKRIDIVEYISQFVPLKQAGKNFKANCPFHNENTPSFMVSPDRQSWRCFGACQEGGDVISFLMKWDNLTFTEALKELGTLTGVQIDQSSFEDREWKEKEKFYKINSLAAQFYNYLLTKHASGVKAREYLNGRNTDDKIIHTFQLGYAPSSWQSLYKFLLKKGISEKDMITVGLVLNSQKGRAYDRFRNRLMFPLMDARNNVIGFSGRLLEDDPKQAKYVNTPETPIYHKRETLFGIQVALDSIRKKKIAIITEGEFDMITSFKNGISNTVAVKGSAVTKEQLDLLKRYTKHIILALDADFSGTETTLRAIREAEEMGFKIEIIRYDYAKDPDEALTKDPIAYKKLLKKPLPIYDFLIEAALSKHNPEDPYGKQEIAEEIVPFIQNISNPIVKGHYTTKLSTLLNVDEKNLYELMKKVEYKERKRLQYKEKNIDDDDVTESRSESSQKIILATLIQSSSPSSSIRDAHDIIEPEDFESPALRDIYTKIITWADAYTSEIQKDFEDTELSLVEFTKSFPQQLQAVIDELYLMDISGLIDDDSDYKAFRRTLYELKRNNLKVRIKQELKKDSTSENIKRLTEKLALVEKQRSIL